MFTRKLKIGLIAASAVSAAVPLLASPAYADLAPAPHNAGTIKFGDTVIVGSDTVQYLVDFAADGDYLGDTGFNSAPASSPFRIVNFDATPDANARLAYGPGGVGPGTCAPGNGGTAGTGNQTTTHADKPCTLNPTIVLRQGLLPVQRPNGSGGGAKASAADTHHYIDATRASSAQGATLGTAWDSITIGNDPFQILESTSPTSNVPATGLSPQQLNSIYACTATTWTAVGGTSTDTIIPIIPQVGSGTRSAFLTNIGNPVLGSCVQTAEENDPTALSSQTNAADAIEPMSGGRLNLFKGILGNGSSSGIGGYFIDPSCQVEATTPAACVSPTNALNPAVQFEPNATGNASDGHPVYNFPRPLYVYFRDADIRTTTPFGTDVPFEPGTTLDFVRALFYNPCSSGQTGCVTIGTTMYGPGGQPWFANPSTGQALVSAAGVAPTYAFTPGGP